MKITIAVAAVSMVFLTIACQTTNENITPTNSTNQTSTPVVVATAKPTNQEIYDTFVRLVLKNSAGTQAMTVRKWLPTQAQIKIYWDAGRTTAMLSALDKLMVDMNLLNKYNKMVRTEAVAEADIIINRTDAATHNAKYASYKVTSTTAQGNTYTQWSGTNINRANIWLSPATPTILQNGVLRHELMHALGLGHTENTKSIMVAVMNGVNYDFNTFSVLDQKTLQILSDIRVKHGNTEANISAVIKEYAAK